MKFGGTCLHPAENRRRVVARILEEEKRCRGIVAVVSAMGRSGDPYATDTLEALLPFAMPRADRERDALLCCGEGIAAPLLAAELLANGVKAVSLSALQLGLVTDGRHGNAEILSIDPTRINHYLDRGFVVVAAGFQGIGEDGSITSLGRGGTDTTAVAIAAGLDTDRVVFFKDVEGLFNADPRIMPEAQPLPLIPYDEAAHLAFAGARVIHPRSAGLAEQEGITIEVRSLCGKGPGTRITSHDAIRRLKPAGKSLFAVTCADGIGQLRVRPSRSRISLDFPRLLFRALADEGLSLDMINLLDDRALFTVPMRDVARTTEIASRSGCDVEVFENRAKVSLLGGGIHGVPGIMARIITALADENVAIHQSIDTNTVISVLVDGRFASRAAQALHRAFGLDRPS